MNTVKTNKKNAVEYKNIKGEDSMIENTIVKHRMGLLEEFQTAHKAKEEAQKAFDKNKRAELKKMVIEAGIDINQSIPARIAGRIGIDLEKWDRPTKEDPTVYQYYKGKWSIGEITTAQLYKERARFGDISIGTYGNKKISKYFFCINAESASKCSSNRCGDCKLDSQCYARAIEGRYEDTKIKNELMRYYWASSSAEQIAEDILILGARKNAQYIQGVRFNVNGDFTNNSVLAKASRIAELLIPYGIVCYSYTHRTKLDVGLTSPYLVINGSTTEVEADSSFLAVNEEDIPANAEYLCPCASDSTKKCGLDCCMCMAGDGRVIYEKLRGTSPKELKEFM